MRQRILLSCFVAVLFLGLALPRSGSAETSAVPEDSEAPLEAAVWVLAADPEPAVCPAIEASLQTSLFEPQPIMMARPCTNCPDCHSATACGGKSVGSGCTVGTRSGTCSLEATCGFLGSCACCSCK